MKPQSIDTHPDIEKVQIELLRQSTPAKRFSIMSSLTDTAIQLSRRAIQRANPSYTDLEVKFAFVSLHYGEDFAEKVKLYWKQNNQ